MAAAPQAADGAQQAQVIEVDSDDIISIQYAQKREATSPDNAATGKKPRTLGVSASCPDNDGDGADSDTIGACAW